MTDATEITVVLDRKTRAIRSGSRWAVQKLRPNGDWDLEAAWDGSRRSLLNWCRDHDVHPTRQAEAQLDGMTEGLTFRERT